MSHQQQMEFVGSLVTRFPDFFAEKKVLEIGSLNINGTVREFFVDCQYLGVDLAPGTGVDFVGEGHRLEFPSDSFDVVISTECFEHNPFWKETFANMIRMGNGLVVITAASSGRPEHGTERTTPQDSPFTINLWDYYMNISAEMFLESLPLEESFLGYELTINPDNHDLYFWGILDKPGHQKRNNWALKSDRDIIGIIHKTQLHNNEYSGKLAFALKEINDRLNDQSQMIEAIRSDMEMRVKSSLKENQESSNGISDLIEKEQRLNDILASRTWRFLATYRWFRSKISRSRGIV